MNPMACGRSLFVIALILVQSLRAQEGPSHVIVTQRAFPEKRISFRSSVGGIAPRLTHWRDEGFIRGFQVLMSSLIDDEGWESMAIVQLGPRGLEQWKRIDPAVSNEAAFSTTVATDLIEQSGVADEAVNSGVYLVIPYEYLVSAAEYRGYARGYVVPQLNGWMKEGVLLGYQLFTARFPAGRSWNALLVLHYRDWIALGQRDSVEDRVRAQLASDAIGKTWANNEQAIRREKVAVIAESAGAK
jgi:hypothetical protein